MHVRSMLLAPPMFVRLVQVHADQVELAMVNTALCADRIGKQPYLRSRPTQDHGLQAVLVVQMGVHGGNGQVMVLVLQAGDALA